MEQSTWERFLHALKDIYYMPCIVLFASFFLLYTIIKHSRKERLSYLFLTYSISCILLFGGLNTQRVFFPTTTRNSTIIDESSNTFFAIIELCVFIIFFYKIIESRISKKFLLFFSAVFFISVLFFVTKVLDVNSNKSEILKASILVNIIEFSIFLIAILSYFIELFKKPPTLDLTQSPSFWISSGLFIYILVSLPLLFFSGYIWVENRVLYSLLFAIHFLSLSLLLFTIAKAFLCRRPIVT